MFDSFTFGIIILIALVVLIIKEYYSYNKFSLAKTLAEEQAQNKKLIEHSEHLTKQIEHLEQDLKVSTENNKKILSQKKSSETRLGQIGEHLVPFLEGCSYDPKQMHFLGNPIDYLIFDLDQGELVFLEVKTGNSKASKRQRTIKNIIKSGNVFYEELRINQKGVTVKREDHE